MRISGVLGGIAQAIGAVLALAAMLAGGVVVSGLTFAWGAFCLSLLLRTWGWLFG